MGLTQMERMYCKKGPSPKCKNSKTIFLDV